MQEELLPPTSAGPAPEDALDAQHVLCASLPALSEGDRELVLHYYRDGLTLRELARELGLSEAATRKRLSRARKRLRAEIRSRLGEPRRTRGWLLAPTGGPIIWPALAKLAGGVVMTTAGMLFGHWLHWRRARDAQERRCLLRCTTLSLAAVLIFPLGLSGTGKVAMLAWLAAFMAFVGHINLVRVARVVGPRHRLERLEDPRAARIQQWLWASGVAGLMVGSAAGTTAIVLSSRPWW